VVPFYGDDEMTEQQDAALYYLIVRRFGTAGKHGVELDQWCKVMLKAPAVFKKVRADYDRMLSDAYVSDTTQFD
jgi:hypothetical protein